MKADVKRCFERAGFLKERPFEELVGAAGAGVSAGIVPRFADEEEGLCSRIKDSDNKSVGTSFVD